MGLFGLGNGAAPIGLDIGSTSFRVAQLKAAADKPILIEYANAKTPKGLITEGEISDVEGVAKELASLWRFHKIVEKRVVVGVANQKVVVRVVEMPVMTEAELRSAIRYQVSDYIPIPADEAIIDFQILSEYSKDSHERVMDVLLVAARKDMIETTVAAVEGAGLKPVVVDVSSLAFARVVMGDTAKPLLLEDDKPAGATALVNVSATLSDIVVVEDNAPRFTRISSIGGSTFTEALVEQLGMSLDEAADLRVRIGLPSADTDEAPAPIDADIKEYAEAVQNVLEQEMVKFIAEIRRSLDYYLVQANRAKSIDKIIVTGGGAKLKNFLEYLKQNLQIEVELGRPLQYFQINKNSLIAKVEEEELSMATCLGLAMRGLDR
ncbi:MAG: type IV pilus assembly protein PilM [Actinobacteria bacterium]|nr:type IV pilus assembly protein PilM [Actinomycetota bacterium]